MKSHLRRTGLSLLLTFLALTLFPVAAQEAEAEAEGAGEAAATAASEARDKAPVNSAVAGDEPDEGLRIDWQPWDRTTFEKAATMKRPVLLYLRARDCRLCQEIEHNVLNTAAAITAVRDHVVPIGVDVDLRPDIGARYVVGAVPTLAFLLPNGEPMYRIEDERTLERVGDHFTDPKRFLKYCAVAERYLLDNTQELLRKAREVAALEAKVARYEPGAPPVESFDDLVQKLTEGIDFTHGGFGRSWKFIDDAPVRTFRLLLALGDDPSLRKAVRKTAEGMMAGEIHDRVEGGFHHYSTARDWSVPALEKRLQVNAKAMRLLVAAAALFPDEAGYRETLAATGEFAMKVLSVPGGTFAFSQLGSLGSDDWGTYFQADEKERQTLRPPVLNPRMVTEGNAEMAVAMLEAAALLGREDFSLAGLLAIDAITGQLYSKGRGFGRYLDDHGRAHHNGLLSDQIAAMEALLMAYQFREREEDLQRIEDVFQFCRLNLRAKAGHFVDRISDPVAVGKLRRPLVSLGNNGRLALIAYRLASLTGKEAYRETGDAALGALAGSKDKLRGRDASYVEALLAVREPRFMALLAGKAAAPGSALRRGSLLIPAPANVVQSLRSGEPSQSQLALPEGEGAAGAYLCWGTICSPPISDPGSLVDAAAASRPVEPVTD